MKLLRKLAVTGLSMVCAFTMTLNNNVNVEAKGINSKGIKYEFGVFNSVDEKDVEKLNEYRTIVIDAQGFSPKTIKKLKRNGRILYQERLRKNL